MVELQRVSGGHGRPPTDGIEKARQRCTPRRGREGSGRRWPRRRSVSWGEDATSCVDHPVGNLAHAEASRVTELLLLLLTWVRMVGVTMEPCLEVIGSLFG